MKTHFDYFLQRTHLKDVLQASDKLQLCNPSPSSWGQGGYHDYWLNENNSWVVVEWDKTSEAMVRVASLKDLSEHESRIIRQAAKELLLLQSSDWSFILKAGTTTELAKERISVHLERFWKLINALEKKSKLSEEFLCSIEKEDCLFPLIEIKDWAK